MLKVSSRILFPPATVPAAHRATRGPWLRRLGPAASGGSPRGFGASSSSITGLPGLLPPSPELPSNTVKAKWNAVSLAFLGDSVWELYVRRCFLFPPKRTSEYYENVVSEVRAESQERYLQQLLAGPVLTDEERDVIRWGSNAKITIPKRFSKSGTHAKTYRAATAIECLMGFLYLTDMQRLQGIMTYIGFEMKPFISQTSTAAADDAAMKVEI